MISMVYYFQRHKPPQNCLQNATQIIPMVIRKTRKDYGFLQAKMLPAEIHLNCGHIKNRWFFVYILTCSTRVAAIWTFRFKVGLSTTAASGSKCTVLVQWNFQSHSFNVSKKGRCRSSSISWSPELLLLFLFAIVSFLPATDLDLSLGADWPGLNLGLSIWQTIETWRRHGQNSEQNCFFCHHKHTCYRFGIQVSPCESKL